MSMSNNFLEFCSLVNGDTSDPRLTTLFEAAGGDISLAVSLYFESHADAPRDSTNITNPPSSKSRKRADDSFGDASSKRRRMDDTDISSSAASAQGLPSPAPSLSASSQSLSAASSMSMRDDEVRAPIQGRTENLMFGPDSGSLPHVAALSAAARAELQQMHASVFGHALYRNRASAPFEGSGALGEMFSVPPGLATEGSLRFVFNRAAQQNKWLLLFLHDPTQLASLQVIRDALRDNGVQRIIRAHYILSVVPHPSPDSQLLLRTYRVSSLPALLVVDPFRSACVLRWEAGEVTAAPWARALVPLWWWVCGGGCDASGAWRGSGSGGGALRGTDSSAVFEDYPDGFSPSDENRGAVPVRSPMTITAHRLGASGPSADEYLQLSLLSARTRTRKAGLSIYDGDRTLQLSAPLLRGAVQALLLAVVHGVRAERRQLDPVRAWREEQCAGGVASDSSGSSIDSSPMEDKDVFTAPAPARARSRPPSSPSSPAAPPMSAAVARGGGVAFSSTGQPLSAVFVNDPRYTGAEHVCLAVGARPMSEAEHARLRAWEQRGAVALDDDNEQSSRSPVAASSPRPGAASVGGTALAQHLMGRLAVPARAAPAPAAPVTPVTPVTPAAAPAAGRQLAATMGVMGIPTPAPVAVPVSVPVAAAAAAGASAAGASAAGASAQDGELLQLRVRLPKGEEARVSVRGDQDQQVLSQALVQALLQHKYSGAKYDITIHPPSGPARQLRLCNPNKPSGKLIRILQLQGCWIDIAINL